MQSPIYFRIGSAGAKRSPQQYDCNILTCRAHIHYILNATLFFTNLLSSATYSHKSPDIRDIERFFPHIGYTGKIEKKSSFSRFQYSRLAGYNKLSTIQKVRMLSSISLHDIERFRPLIIVRPGNEERINMRTP